MMKKHLRSCAALLMACMMFITGCAGTKQEEGAASADPVQSTESEKTDALKEETKEEEAKEVITIEVFGGTAGAYENLWWTEMLEEDLGIKIQCLGSDAELLDTYIAAGDLPDIMRINDTDTQQLAYEAGLLVNLDEYKELLPNLYELCPEGALQFQRDKYEDKGLYTVPSGAGTDQMTYGYGGYITRMDFPYFLEYCEANGDPELKDLEDMIPVLKWIQEQHPTNADGQPAYGMSLFSDWDGIVMSDAVYWAEQYGVKQIGYNEIDMDTLERKSIFDDDSVYKRMLKFFYEANQAGILDPDAMTHSYDDYAAKVLARRVYTSYGFADNEYMKFVPYENQHSTDNSGALRLGNGDGNWGICISATSEHVERVCEFLNYCMDPDKWWELKLGPKGEYWDVNDAGQPYVTEFGMKMNEDPNVQFSTGGNINDSTSISAWNWRFIANEYVYPAYGTTASSSSWPTASVDQKTETQKLWEDWLVEKYDFKHPGGVVSEQTAKKALVDLAEIRQGSTGKSAPDNLIELGSRFSAVVPTMCWQMIYASSEAEFESIWDDMVEQVTEMGVEEYRDWYYEDYIAGVEGYAAYCY